jgi:diacylglycerol kinase (ATP)
MARLWNGGSSMAHERFSVLARIRSFRFAIAGLAYMLRSQQNAQVHLAITVIVCGAGLLMGISAADWRWLVIAISLVWIAETVNTAFEYLCDVVSPGLHDGVAKAKDIAAGAVLVAAATAVVIGLLVFLPYMAHY